MANPTATPANENVTVPAVSKNHMIPNKLAPKRVQPIENSGKPPLQCNEVTSSDDETNTTPPVPKRSSSSANMKAKFNKNKSLNRELAALQQDHDGVSRVFLCVLI